MDKEQIIREGEDLHRRALAEEDERYAPVLEAAAAEDAKILDRLSPFPEGLRLGLERSLGI